MSSRAASQMSLIFSSCCISSFWCISASCCTVFTAAWLAAIMASRSSLDDWKQTKKRARKRGGWGGGGQSGPAGVPTPERKTGSSGTPKHLKPASKQAKQACKKEASRVRRPGYRHQNQHLCRHARTPHQLKPAPTKKKRDLLIALQSSAAGKKRAALFPTNHQNEESCQRDHRHGPT